MAKICMVLTGSTIEENRQILKANRDLIDMVELRTDLLNEDQFDRVVPFSREDSTPFVLTCRKPCDGGKWQGGEKRRLSLLEEWLEGDFDFIDIEMDADASFLEKKAGEKGITVIRSFHDFNGVPANLYETMTRFKGSIAKGALYPRTSKELFKVIETALKLKEEGESPFILLGMGDFGFPTRILAEKMGSYLTFCSDSGAPSGAPGHCTAADLNDIYHFREVNGDTVVNSIIGNPVSQSRSPHLHNQWYREKKMNAVYVPFLTDSPEWFIKTADLLKINGSSVTVPFKSEIISLVDKTDKAVDVIGASNTIYRDSSGQWAATNTDTYGLIKPLLYFLGTESLSGRKAAVIGAGGAARAAVFALQEKGADVAVFNRTVKRAEDLAREFGCRAFGLSSEYTGDLREYGSILVQTSSAGMPPLENVDPVGFFDFDGSEVVYDIIYKPEVTVMMARAKEAGCPVLGGFKMLEEQAKLQFEIFQQGSLK